MFWQSIKTFMTVVEKGSINKAADSIFLSPPAVKKQIDQLEAQLGFRLFIRNNRGSTLTPAGESFFKDACFVAKYMEYAADYARRITEDHFYQIRIGTSLLSPCAPLLEIWNRICDDYPLFRLTIVSFSDDSESMKKNFRNIGKDFDIMVRICDVTNWKNNFQFLEIKKSPVSIFVPRSHRMSSKKMLSIPDLYGERVAIIEEGTSAIIDEISRFLRAEHPQINIENKGPHYDIDLFNKCAEDNRPLIAPDIWKKVHPYMISIPVDWNYTMPFGLSYPLNPTKETEMFIEIIRETISH